MLILVNISSCTVILIRVPGYQGTRRSKFIVLNDVYFQLYIQFINFKIVYLTDVGLLVFLANNMNRCMAEKSIQHFKVILKCIS